jgi:hypothetical protein
MKEDEMEGVCSTHVIDNININLVEVDCEDGGGVDRTGSGSFPMANFGISCWRNVSELVAMFGQKGLKKKSEDTRSVSSQDSKRLLLGYESDLLPFNLLDLYYNINRTMNLPIRCFLSHPSWRKDIHPKSITLENEICYV